jgi:UPF0755 protein
VTVRKDRSPRARAGNVGPTGYARGRANPQIVDRGWDDYLPPDPHEAEQAARKSEIRRDYHRPLFSGHGPILRFAAFAFVLATLVVSGLYFLVRPGVARGLVDFAAENPTVLQLPFVADLVRSQLGDSLTAPVDPSDTSPVVVVISSGQTPREIAEQLVAAGLIRDARAFVFEGIEQGVTERFQSGRHVLSRSMTIDQILTALIAAPTPNPRVHIVFREGLRIEQLVAKLEYAEANPDDPSAPLTMNVKQFYQLAMNPPADLIAQYKWLALPPGASLEGFLFPATYDLDPSTTPDQLLALMLDAFVNHAPPGLLELPPDQLYQTVQLASLVETEAMVDADRAPVAGTYLNRLDPNLWPTGLLDADPTLKYATDTVWLRDNDISTWVDYTFWNALPSGPLGQAVFPDDLAGYNTYHSRGLPPTPICSPGAASLLAAMNPDTADGYLYFVAKNDGSGTLAFARTEAEHQANLHKYGYLP